VPTWELTAVCERDYESLDAEERRAFRQALKRFISDLEDIEKGTRHQFRGGLRVKPMQNAPGIWEMTWKTRDGRATFSYGSSTQKGKRHVIWRRIGGHEVFGSP